MWTYFVTYVTPEVPTSVCSLCYASDMATDNTENIRRELIETGQVEADAFAALAAGQQTWDTDQLRAEFEVLGFAAPFVVVKRRSDGKKGSLEFNHNPRVYFGWRED